MSNIKPLIDEHLKSELTKKLNNPILRYIHASKTCRIKNYVP